MRLSLMDKADLAPIVGGSANRQDRVATLVRVDPEDDVHCLSLGVGLIYNGPQWRRTQVAKGEVCKTSIHRFESGRRLHLTF